MRTRTIAPVVAAGVSFFADRLWRPPDRDRTVARSIGHIVGSRSRARSSTHCAVCNTRRVDVRGEISGVVRRPLPVSPDMVLTETGGKSAAKLISISLSLPDGASIDIANNAEPGNGCFLTSDRSPSQPAPRAMRAASNWYCLDIDSHSTSRGVRLVSRSPIPTMMDTPA
jgi:hypothetical protein